MENSGASQAHRATAESSEAGTGDKTSESPSAPESQTDPPGGNQGTPSFQSKESHLESPLLGSTGDSSDRGSLPVYNPAAVSTSLPSKNLVHTKHGDSSSRLQVDRQSISGGLPPAQASKRLSAEVRAKQQRRENANTSNNELLVQNISKRISNHKLKDFVEFNRKIQSSIDELMKTWKYHNDLQHDVRNQLTILKLTTDNFKSAAIEIAVEAYSYFENYIKASDKNSNETLKELSSGLKSLLLLQKSQIPQMASEFASLKKDSNTLKAGVESLRKQIEEEINHESTRPITTELNKELHSLLKEKLNFEIDNYSMIYTSEERERIKKILYKELEQILNTTPKKDLFGKLKNKINVTINNQISNTRLNPIYNLVNGKLNWITIQEYINTCKSIIDEVFKHSGSSDTRTVKSAKTKPSPAPRPANAVTIQAHMPPNLKPSNSGLLDASHGKTQIEQKPAVGRSFPPPNKNTKSAEEMARERLKKADEKTPQNELAEFLEGSAIRTNTIYDLVQFNHTYNKNSSSYMNVWKNGNNFEKELSKKLESLKLNETNFKSAVIEITKRVSEDFDYYVKNIGIKENASKALNRLLRALKKLLLFKLSDLTTIKSEFTKLNANQQQLIDAIKLDISDKDKELHDNLQEKLNKGLEDTILDHESVKQLKQILEQELSQSPIKYCKAVLEHAFGQSSSIRAITGKDHVRLTVSQKLLLTFITSQIPRYELKYFVIFYQKHNISNNPLSYMTDKRELGYGFKNLVQILDLKDEDFKEVVIEVAKDVKSDFEEYISLKDSVFDKAADRYSKGLKKLLLLDRVGIYNIKNSLISLKSNSDILINAVSPVIVQLNKKSSEGSTEKIDGELRKELLRIISSNLDSQMNGTSLETLIKPALYKDINDILNTATIGNAHSKLMEAINSKLKNQIPQYPLGQTHIKLNEKLDYKLGIGHINTCKQLMQDIFNVK